MTVKKSYDETKANELITRLSDGETLTSICKDLGLTPSIVWWWTETVEEFATRYAKAREYQTEVLEDLAIDVSNERAPDVTVIETDTDKGPRKKKVDYDNYNRSRLQADTYLKIVNRRKGAKITNEIKFIRKNEAELAAEMTNEQLLEIARMRVENGTDHGKTN